MFLALSVCHLRPCHFADSIPRPGCRDMLLEAYTRVPVMSVSTLLGSQGQDENELREKEKKERQEARGSLL